MLSCKFDGNARYVPEDRCGGIGKTPFTDRTIMIDSRACKVRALTAKHQTAPSVRVEKLRSIPQNNHCKIKLLVYYNVQRIYI